MKVYWQLACEDGHRWGGFFDEAADLPMQCAEGHSAVICRKLLAIDQVQVTLRPAGRMIDLVTKQFAFERQVWVIVSDLQGQWEYQSEKTYAWRDAEQLIRRFECCPLEKAKQIIQSNPF